MGSRPDKETLSDSPNDTLSDSESDGSPTAAETPTAVDGTIEIKVDGTHDQVINSVVNAVHQLVQHEVNSKNYSVNFVSPEPARALRTPTKNTWSYFRSQCEQIWKDCANNCLWGAPCRGRLLCMASEQQGRELTLELFSEALFVMQSTNFKSDLMNMRVIPCCKFTLVEHKEVQNHIWEEQRFYALCDKSWMRSADDANAYGLIRDMAVNNIQNFAPRIMDVVSVRNVAGDGENAASADNRGLFAAHNILAGTAVMCWKQEKELLTNETEDKFVQQYSFKPNANTWSVPHKPPKEMLTKQLTARAEVDWVKKGVAQMANNECNPILSTIMDNPAPATSFNNHKELIPASILFNKLLEAYDFRADSMFHWLWRTQDEYTAKDRLQIIRDMGNCISRQVEFIKTYKTTLQNPSDASASDSASSPDSIPGDEIVVLPSAPDVVSQYRDCYGFVPLQCLCAPPTAQLSHAALSSSLSAGENDSEKTENGVMTANDAWLTEDDIDVALAWWAHKTNNFHVRTLHNYNKEKPQSSFHKCLIASTSAVSELYNTGTCEDLNKLNTTNSTDEKDIMGHIENLISENEDKSLEDKSLEDKRSESREQLTILFRGQFKCFGSLTKVLSDMQKDDSILTLPLHFCVKDTDTLQTQLSQIWEGGESSKDRNMQFLSTVLQYIDKDALTPYAMAKTDGWWEHDPHESYIEKTTSYMTQLTTHVKNASTEVFSFYQEGYLFTFLIQFIRGINGFANAKRKLWQQFMIETQPVADNIWTTVQKNHWTLRQNRVDLQEQCRTQSVLGKKIASQTEFNHNEGGFVVEQATEGLPFKILHAANEYKIPKRLLVARYDKLLIPLNGRMHWWLGEFVLNPGESSFGQFRVYNSLPRWAGQCNGWLELHGLLRAQAHFELHFCNPDTEQRKKLLEFLQQEIQTSCEAFHPFVQKDGAMCGIVTILTTMALTINPSFKNTKDLSPSSLIQHVVLTNGSKPQSLTEPTEINPGSAIICFLRTWVALVKIYGVATPTQHSEQHNLLMQHGVLASENRVAPYGTGNLLRCPGEKDPWAVFYAAQNVQEGEELLYTYNAVREDNHVTEFTCKCRFCASSFEVFCTWLKNLKTLIRSDWIPEEARGKWTSIEDKTIREKLLAVDKQWKTSHEKFLQHMSNLSKLIERSKKGASRGDPIIVDSL